MARVTLRGKLFRTRLKETDQYPRYYVLMVNNQMFRVSFEEVLKADLNNEEENKFDKGIEVEFEAAKKKTGKFRWGYKIRSLN